MGSLWGFCRTALTVFPADVTPAFKPPHQHSNSSQSWVTSANHAIPSHRKSFQEFLLAWKDAEDIAKPCIDAQGGLRVQSCFYSKKGLWQFKPPEPGVHLPLSYSFLISEVSSLFCALHSGIVFQIRLGKTGPGLWHPAGWGLGKQRQVQGQKATSSPKVLELYVSTCSAWGLSLYYLRNENDWKRRARKEAKWAPLRTDLMPKKEHKFWSQTDLCSNPDSIT